MAETRQFVAHPPVQQRGVCILEKKAYRLTAHDHPHYEASSGLEFSKTGMFSLVLQTYATLMYSGRQAWTIEPQTGEPNRWATGPPLVQPELSDDRVGSKKVPCLDILRYITLTNF
jgi:hypothetical protein